jgi:hypothetical protein
MRYGVTQVNQHAVRIAGIVFPAANIDLHQQGDYTKYFECAYRTEVTATLVYLTCAYEPTQEVWEIERYITSPMYDASGGKFYPPLQPMRRHVVYRSDEGFTQHVAVLASIGMHPLSPIRVWDLRAPVSEGIRECSE